MDPLIKELMEIGLNKYEASAYRTLLDSSHLTASELSKLGKIPHGRIYAILDSLVRKGFCYTLPGSVKKFKAIEPKIAMASLITEERKSIEIREERMLKLAEKLESVTNPESGDGSSPLDCIEVLTTRSSMFERAWQLGRETEHVIRAFNKRPYTMPRNFDEPEKVTAPVTEIINRIDSVRGLWEIEEDNLENFIKWISHFEKAGEDVRVCESLPVKMFIYDTKAVLCGLHNMQGGKDLFTTLIVKQPEMTLAMVELFDIYWEKSLTLEQFLKERKLKYPS